MARPAEESALESADWMRDALETGNARGAIVVDTSEGCVRVYRYARLMGVPAASIDFSIEPIPLAIHDTSPELFRDLLETTLLARLFHQLNPSPARLRKLGDRLGAAVGAEDTPVAVHREFAREVALQLCILATHSSATDLPAEAELSGRWPPNLRIAALNNRASLLIYLARAAPLEADARRNRVVAARDQLLEAQKLAADTEASPLRRAALGANFATALSLLASVDASDQTYTLREAALDQWRQIADLLADGPHIRLQVQVLMNYASGLAATPGDGPGKRVLERIVTLRRALQLCGGLNAGIVGDVRRELAAALLDRPDVQPQANAKEAVPHIRASTTLYRDAIAKCVGIDDKVYLTINLINNEILLAQLTGKVDHVSGAIGAASDLKKILSAAGRAEDCVRINALIDRLTPRSTNIS